MHAITPSSKECPNPKFAQNAIELPPVRTARMAELGISGGRCKVFSGRKFPGSIDRLREIFSDEDNTFLLYPGKDSSPIEDIVAERTEESRRLRDVTIFDAVVSFTAAAQIFTTNESVKNKHTILVVKTHDSSYLCNCSQIRLARRHVGRGPQTPRPESLAAAAQEGLFEIS